MKNTIKRYVAIVLTLLLCLAVMPSNIFADDSKVIYVSTTGSDANAGTIDRPLATLEAARDKARGMQKSKDDPVTIMLRGGYYRLNKGLQLDEQDNYTVYKAYEGEKPIVTLAGNLPKEKWEYVTDEAILARVPEIARDNLKTINLPNNGIDSFGPWGRTYWPRMSASFGTKDSKRPFSGVAGQGMLIVNGEMQDLSRWPNEHYDFIGNVLEPPYSGVYRYEVDKDRIKNWATADQAYIHGLFTNDYGDASAEILGYDVEAGAVIVNLKANTEYRYSINNLLEEIDVPGEFFLDRNTGNMYFFENPEHPIENASFLYSMDPVIEMTDTSFITLDGLTIEGSANFGVYMSVNCTDNLVQNCEIRNCSGYGIDFHGFRNGVTNCYVHHCGNGGIHISNREPQTPGFWGITPEQNYITHNHVQDASMLSVNYCPPIKAQGNGNIISHNRIHDCQQSAINWHGVGNTITYNDVYDACREGGDAGVFYDWPGFTSTGNVLSNNFIHACYGPEYLVNATGERRYFMCAMYTDNCIVGNEFNNNLFYDIYQIWCLHGTRNSTIRNNLTVKTDVANYNGTLNGDLMTSMLKHRDNMLMIAAGEKSHEGTQYKELWDDYVENYDPTDPEWDKYPYFKTFITDDPMLPKYNVFENNVTFEMKEEKKFNEVIEKYSTIRNNYYTKDPMPNFRDPVTGKYTIDYDLIRQHVPEFEELEFDKFGTGEKDLATGDFYVCYPWNNATDVKANSLTFHWEKSKGANLYRVMIARDPEFKDMIYDDVTKEAYLELPTLKYGKKTYYWKVQAQSTSPAYSTYTWNVGGTRKFTTAMYEDCDTEKIDKSIAEAQEIIATVPVGDAEGAAPQDRMDTLKLKLATAEKAVKELKSQRHIDKANENLEKEIVTLHNSRNPAYVDFGPMIADIDNWKANVSVDFDVNSKGVLTIPEPTTSNVAVGYMGRKIQNYEILKFKMKLGLCQNNYQVLQIRSSGPTARVPWDPTNSSYALLFETQATSGVEFQRFLIGGKILEFKNYSQLKDFDATGWNDYEMGCLQEGENPRFILKVNGELAFDYVVTDPLHHVKDPAYFGITLMKGSGEVQLAGADVEVE